MMIRILVVGLWAVVSLVAQGDESARVVTVRDSEGAPLAGARVRLECLRSALLQAGTDLLYCAPLPSGETDEAGRFEARIDTAVESALFLGSRLQLVVEHEGFQPWVEEWEGLGSWRGSDVRLRRWSPAETVRVACSPLARIVVRREGVGVVADEVLLPDDKGLVNVRVPLQPCPVFVPDRPQRLRTAVCQVIPGHDAAWVELWPGMGAVALEKPAVAEGAVRLDWADGEAVGLFHAELPLLDGESRTAPYFSYPGTGPRPMLQGGVASLYFVARPGRLIRHVSGRATVDVGTWLVTRPGGPPVAGAVVWHVRYGVPGVGAPHRFITDARGEFDVNAEQLAEPGAFRVLAAGHSRGNGLGGRPKADRVVLLGLQDGGIVKVRAVAVEQRTGRRLQKALIVHRDAQAAGAWALPGRPFGIARTDADGVAELTAGAEAMNSARSSWSAHLSGYRRVGSSEEMRDGVHHVRIEMERVLPVTVTSRRPGGVPAPFAPLLDRRVDSPRTDSRGVCHLWFGGDELPLEFRPPRHTLEQRFEQTVTKDGGEVVLPSGRALTVRLPFVSRLAWSASYDRGGVPPQDHSSGPGYGAVIVWGQGMQEVLLGGPGIATARIRTGDVTADTRVVDRSRTVRRVPIRFVAEGGAAVAGVRVAPCAEASPSQVGDLMGEFARVRQGRPELHFTDTGEWQCVAYHPSYLPQRFTVPAQKAGEPDRPIRVAFTRGASVGWSRTGPFEPHTHVRIVWHATNPKEQEEYREPVATFDTRLSAAPPDDWEFRQPAALAPGTYWVEIEFGSLRETRQIAVGEDPLDLDL